MHNFLQHADIHSLMNKNPETTDTKTANNQINKTPCSVQSDNTGP